MAHIASTAPALVAPNATQLRIVPARMERQATTPGRLALTRRGRFILIGLPVMIGATVLLVLAGIFTAPVMASDATGSAPVDATTVAVLEGDTIWDLAAEFAPNRDRQEVVAEISEMNDLPGAVLIPGQQIFVPTDS